VAVMVGVESASGGGSASTDLRALLASILKRYDASRVDIVCGGRHRSNWTRRPKHAEMGGTVTRGHVMPFWSPKEPSRYRH